MKNKNGFTLIEILAVIIIIGIGSTIGIVAISNSINQSRDSSFIDLAKTYAEATRTMRASEKLYYEPKNGEAVIIPYSEVDGSDIENKNITGYGEILPTYCYVSAVNNNNNYSYYVTQVDETYHIINNIEYNELKEDYILVDVEQMAANNVKELKAPYSGFSMKYGNDYYDIKAVRAVFDATVSQTQSNTGYNNVKVTVFDKKGDRNKTIFSGSIKLYHEIATNKDKIELKVTKSTNNLLPAKKYVFETKSGNFTGFVGTWLITSNLNDTLYLVVKNVDDNSFNFDIKVGNKVVYENMVSSNKTTLYGQFYGDSSYYSSNVAIKGTLSDYDSFVTSGKFSSSHTNEVTYDGVLYKLENSKIIYAIAKKN